MRLASGPERQRAQLTIPKAPKFPLSSPITDEIASPTTTTSSSPEDRDLERNRPFEFLSKMSSRNPYANTAPDRIRTFEQGVISRTNEGRGELSSNPFAAPRNPERPVGLNLDIPTSNPQPRKETTGAFVDLNDLKVLSKAREEERTAQKLKGILKKGDAKKEKGDTRGFQKLPDDPSGSDEGRKRTSLLDGISKSSKKNNRHDGISPTDRPIVIGFSVPYDSPDIHDEKSKELDSAGTLHTPLTPSIIVTPAKDDGFWEQHLSPERPRPRAASSVYSQPSPHPWVNQADVPPVPALPALYSSGNDGGNASPTGPGVSIDAVRKRRSFSTGAVNEKSEEDHPGGRPRSRSNEKVPRPADRLTINTSLNARASHGWWNYLLSPLLSASSILSPKTPTIKSRPKLPTISTSSTGLTDEWWDEKEKWEETEKEKEKEVSHFSPDTPEATRRISSWQTASINPFADFDWSIDEQAQAPRDRDVASMMFSGERIRGEAAEYYQACAHELFSGTPYFECVNHVCSITPKVKVPVVDARPTQENIEGSRGLLIDVDDMPRSHNQESPASGITSINSSPSDNESRISRDLETSLGATRESPSERASEMPKAGSPIPEFDRNTRQLDSPGQKHPPTNPFLEQSRGFTPPPQNAPFQPPPPSNVHIESAPTPAPANIHIEAPAAQPAPNIHYQAPPPPPPPMALDAPEPYVASREPVPFRELSPVPPSRSATRAPPPPPIAMPDREQTPPPNYGVQSHSPYPHSPESLQESTERGAVRLSNMPVGPAPAYTPHDNSALPPRVRAVPITQDVLGHPVAERDRIEHRRRRYEREDAAGRKAGGWWRGRGPFSNKGCFGRTGREGRLRRRWYFAICLFFIAIVVGAILLAVLLTRKGDGTPVQSQWLNLTGYPPMPTGISTIAGPEAQKQESGCIVPTSLWSCALPKEQQAANKPYKPNQPNFRMEVRFQNGTYGRSTTIASRSLQMLSRSANQLFNPSPSPPSTDEQIFLGETTDKTSEPYNGEETPFYITMLSAEHLTSSSSQLDKRDSNSSHFPALEGVIPSPAVDSDGSAAPAVLYPFPSSQPVRLYNRGKDNEHYGFYTYYDKSIFSSSSTPLTGKNDPSANDTAGGSTKANARVRCTWAQTRFLVQIWTKPEKSGKAIFDRTGDGGNKTASKSESSSPSPTSTSSFADSAASSSATDFTRPGSFPYPVTITLDRHGGNPGKKLLYCYGMEGDGHVNGTEKLIQMEDRSFAGKLVHKAPGIFNNTGSSDSSDDEDKDGEKYGGYDGGTGGCSCQWVNWIGSD